MPYALDQANDPSLAVSGRCPYFEAGCACRASFSRLMVDKNRVARYCCSEDYDLCPLFLSKLLRSSRPRYGGNLSGDFLHK
jgi:hypothetical protein